MSISCGHCKGTHESVAQVRLCAQRSGFRAQVPANQPRPADAPRVTFADVVTRLGQEIGTKRRYALKVLRGGAEAVKLFEVRRTDQGKTFVNAVTAHGGTRIDLENRVQFAVLRQLAEDPQGAAELYGHVTGHCYRCGRFLSDPESVQRGIGPECFRKIEAA